MPFHSYSMVLHKESIEDSTLPNMGEVVEESRVGRFHLDNIFPQSLLRLKILLMEFSLLRTMDRPLHGSEEEEDSSTG